MPNPADPALAAEVAAEVAADIASRPGRYLTLVRRPPASSSPSPLPPPLPATGDGDEAARLEHPAGSGLPWPRPRIRLLQGFVDEGGSLVAEYGLLLVLGATITMLATKWATGGAIWTLFGAVLSRARALVGA